MEARSSGRAQDALETSARRGLRPESPARAGAPGSDAQSRAKLYACIALLTPVIFVVDVSMPWVAFGGFYAIPILISLWLKRFRVTLGLTVVCSLLALGEAFAQVTTGDAVSDEEHLRIRYLAGNHAAQMACLWVVCLIGYWRLRDERELEESRETTATTLSSIAEGVITVDSGGRVTYLNHLAEQLAGCTRPEALGQPIEAVMRLSDESPLHVPIEDLPADLAGLAGPRLSRATLVPRRGRQVPVEIVSSPLRGPQGVRRGDVIVFRDITEREQRERDMRRLAYRDALTGLPNRLSLHELLKLELAHARRNQTELAVLFLDLDDFKEVNDSLGHAAGDHVLRTMAVRLRSHLRETDTVARLGGDEFAVVVPGASSARDGELVATKLLSALEEPVLFEGREVRVRASIGMAMFPRDGTDADDLLRRADQVMYRAKQQGGGRLGSTVVER